jgi:hypothetical protein
VNTTNELSGFIQMQGIFLDAWTPTDFSKRTPVHSQYACAVYSIYIYIYIYIDKKKFHLNRIDR